MDFQDIMTFVLLGAAVGYLYYRFFGKKKNKGKNCGKDSNCGCS
jgi:glycopeptide antibiotics resistance protein